MERWVSHRKKLYNGILKGCAIVYWEKKIIFISSQQRGEQVGLYTWDQFLSGSVLIYADERSAWGCQSLKWAQGSNLSQWCYWLEFTLALCTPASGYLCKMWEPEPSCSSHSWTHMQGIYQTPFLQLSHPILLSLGQETEVKPHDRFDLLQLFASLFGAREIKYREQLMFSPHG